ncbi:amidase domain-containing protein [Shouchella shacheensis]|uniref:amidase domain-containing protein n=1 Tax=Shouchella shacheensis TaxID=1649580 RepID=UPI0007403E11|nr:amidase domain-containing protein [Shouchella shacheensis]
MNNQMIQAIHERAEEINRSFLTLAPATSIGEEERFECSALNRSDVEIVHSKVHGDVTASRSYEETTEVEYFLLLERLIQRAGDFYVEERELLRRATFTKDELQSDVRLVKNLKGADGQRERRNDWSEVRENQDSSGYNRREAVRYAERWWNDYNPDFPQFEDNCTNYISQCLHAGGAPMTGQGSRDKGWWYSGRSWSFSWATAHSLRWYLSGAKTGLRGEEREHAEQLMPGDVICYDFNGDGRFDHNTIVVAKDRANEPLVNAQTVNSRMRHWAYTDSPAYTEDIVYKFFHIVVD